MIENKKYDYLIVGAGLFGSVFAWIMKENGKKCLVIEKRDHIGGNCYTKEVMNGDVHMHVYGPHIFHTQRKWIWNFVNEMATMDQFVNAPIANYKGHLFNLPFNMNTFNKMWPAIVTPSQARAMIESQKSEFSGEPKNLEEQAIKLVGRDIYEKLIKGYTEKQWGRKCTELDPSIIKRIPVRYTYDNNYFSDPYQGMPRNGYTEMFEKLLEGTDVLLKTDFFDNVEYWKSQAKKVVYTGPIDQLFGFVHGHLPWRTLKFETKIEDADETQGCAVMNYTDSEVPYTRVTEHAYFTGIKGKAEEAIQSSGLTYKTYEYSKEYENGDEPYYPVDNDETREMMIHYKAELQRLGNENIILGGRLGTYKYYNMDQVIMNAFETAECETGIDMKIKWE